MKERKRIVVVGATGTNGKALSTCLIERGYDVIVFSRNPDAAPKSVPGAVINRAVSVQPGKRETYE